MQFGRYLQPSGDWNDGLNMPFVFLRDETYMNLSVGCIKLTSELDASIEIIQGVRSVVCNERASFYNQHPFVDQITFVFAVQTTDADVKIVVRSIDSEQIAVGRHTFQWESDEFVDDTETVVVTLYEPDAKMIHASNPGLELNNSVGSITIQASVLASKALSMRSRWTQGCQSSMIQKVWWIVGLRGIICSWKNNMPGAKYGRPVSMDQVSQFSEAEQHNDEIYLDQLSEHSFQSCMGANEDEASMPLSDLHPLEQHTGSQVISQNEVCTCCRTKSKLHWTGTHPLSLGHQEGLHVLPADAWKVPAAGHLVDDTTAPPVAQVTCIYGMAAPFALTHSLLKSIHHSRCKCANFANDLLETPRSVRDRPHCQEVSAIGVSVGQRC